MSFVLPDAFYTMSVCVYVFLKLLKNIILGFLPLKFKVGTYDELIYIVITNKGVVIH